MRDICQDIDIVPDFVRLRTLVLSINTLLIHQINEESQIFSNNKGSLNGNQTENNADLVCNGFV